MFTVDSACVRASERTYARYLKSSTGTNYFDVMGSNVRSACVVDEGRAFLQHLLLLLVVVVICLFVSPACSPS